MRTLSRPMFNMGGPIKQGVMHGIREPYKGGGAALVGDPRFPKDETGRAHHYAWVSTALAGIPKIYKGFKAARTFDPALKGLSKWKNIFPSGRFRDYKGKIPLGGTGTTRGQLVPYGAGVDTSGKMGLWQSLKDPRRFGAAMRENPLTSLGLGYTALGVPRNVPDILGAGWDATKWTGRKVRDQIFGDTFKEPPPPTGVTLPGGGETAEGSGAAYYSKNKTKKDPDFTNTQRDAKVNRYLQLMGYDRAKKTAIADALIDASKIVSDRGTLDRKNITGELINPAIQALSKRLDKPDQIREAVGLMMVKGEIEKDLEDPTVKALRLEQLKGLRGGFSKDIGDFILSAKGTKVKPEALKRYARAKADQHGLDFTVVTDEMIAGAGEGASEDAIIQSVVKDDGVYMIGDAIIQVTGGIPKQIA